jgi:hippurate hydrolase
MDALPVTEATNLDYASQEPGKMHACGHDTHVAAGLAGAALLAPPDRGLGGDHAGLVRAPDVQVAGRGGADQRP